MIFWVYLAASTAEEEEETAEGDQREEQVAEERHIVALLLALADADVDAVLGQDIHQIRVIGQHHQSAPAYARHKAPMNHWQWAHQAWEDDLTREPNDHI